MALAQDLADYRDLVEILERKVGRLIFNGFPTGVEVSHAMVHGGPYPATSDSRTTSVGSMAIFRFARPVCFQGFPGEALPPELQDPNPLGIWRLVDGKLTREPAQATECSSLEFSVTNPAQPGTICNYSCKFLQRHV